MAEFNITMKTNNIPPMERAKILARVYSEILSWPDPREIKSGPVAGNLGEDAAAGPVHETPEISGESMETKKRDG